MPTNPLDTSASGRRTGERAMFLNKVNLAARQTITQAKNDRATALASGHENAEARLREAHGKAIDIIGQNLERVYLHVAGYPDPARWVVTDAGGSVLKSTSPNSKNESMTIGVGPTPIGSPITIADGRIYFINNNALVSTNLDGGDQRLMSLGTDWDQNGGNAALDAEQGVVFSVLWTSVIMKTNLSDGSTTQVLKLPRAMSYSTMRISVDTTKHEIYWSNGHELGVVNYDGSGSTVLCRDGTPSSQIDLIAVDSQHGCFYGIRGARYAGGEVWRARRDDLLRRPVLRGRDHYPFAAIDAVTIDVATQLIYWVGNDEGYVHLFRAPLGTIDAADYDAREHGRLLFAPPTTRNLFDIALLTSTDRASQELASATYQSHHARIEAPRTIVQAHQDAQTQRDEAHAKLAQAHAQAELDISSKQEQAAKDRAKKQLDAQATKASADQLILSAREKAERDRGVANEAAKSSVDQARSKAAVKKSEAQAELDAARRRLQNP